MPKSSTDLDQDGERSFSVGRGPIECLGTAPEDDRIRVLRLQGGKNSLVSGTRARSDLGCAVEDLEDADIHRRDSR